jgi:Skp family chaperone for outer membrane proteins
VVKLRVLTASAFAAALLSAGAVPGTAQQNQEWFVPNQAQRPATTPRPAPRPAAPAAGVQPGAGLLAPEGAAPGAEGQAPQVQVQLPPPPDVPPLPKGATPPAAIVGVLSVTDVMRASAAFQQADKEFLARRQKLNEDAQKEQVTLRDLGQQLANERGKLTPEQIRNREKDLQDRITESRRTFGERNRVIQEASQYVMAQIDRAVELVTQQVAISHGINIVLNRAQILGTTNDFDLTPQVVDDLNKVLTAVVIPPDGVSPVAFQPPAGSAPPATAALPVAPQGTIPTGPAPGGTGPGASPPGMPAGAPQAAQAAQGTPTPTPMPAPAPAQAAKPPAKPPATQQRR